MDQHRNFDNRLSDLQRQIIAHLATVGQAIREGDARVYFGHLPRTGDIVDAVGRARDKKGYASVSRSLARLEAAGLVSSCQGMLRTRGNGYRWALAIPEAPSPGADLEASR